MPASCFVIQPFDGGKYDRRYDDVFAPAIRAAGLEPYRVDRDPAVVIPIAEIEAGIRNAAACLADITEDNPNVWFELGFAIANGGPTCLVCSTERMKFPFDVQHRNVIRYETGSKSDFDRLASGITARLKALLTNDQQARSIASIQRDSVTGGLLPHEMSALALLAAPFGSEGQSFYAFQQSMGRVGFTETAATIAVESLRRKGFLELDSARDMDGSEYTVWRASESGMDWLIQNQDKLRLRANPPEETGDKTDL